jgi:hypothetical protein
MTKQSKAKRIVEHGAGWNIEYSPMDREYIPVIKEVGPIGFASTKDEARDLIHDWMFEQTPNACAGFGCVDECGDCMQVTL